MESVHHDQAGPLPCLLGLPARQADGKAEKIVHKLHVFIKNEW